MPRGWIDADSVGFWAFVILFPCLAAIEWSQQWAKRGRSPLYANRAIDWIKVGLDGFLGALMLAGIAHFATVPINGLVAGLLNDSQALGRRAAATVVGVFCLAAVATILKYWQRLVYGVVEVSFALVATWKIVTESLISDPTANAVALAGGVYLVGEGLSNIYEALDKPGTPSG